MQEIIGGLILALGDLVGLGALIFPIVMGLTLFALLFIGIPVAIALAISGFLFAYLGGEFALFNLLPIRIFGVMDNQTLMAVPLFVFMGVMLERSRLAEDLLDVIGHAAGGLRGGRLNRAGCRTAGSCARSSRSASPSWPCRRWPIC